MFDIHGDEITYRGIRFATIDGVAWSTLRADAEGELLNGSDDFIRIEEHDAAIEEAEERGLKAGRDENADERTKLVSLLEDALATLESNGDPDDDHLVGQIIAAIKEAKAE